MNDRIEKLEEQVKKLTLAHYQNQLEQLKREQNPPAKRDGGPSMC